MMITENKKALHEYKILEKWQAGIKLTGPEVKAVKMGRIDLRGSYLGISINPKNNIPETWLIGANIAKYPKSGYSQKNYDSLRKRKILLNRKEINSILGKINQKGLTVIPILVYTSQRLVKVEIALVQGKRKFDKREELKKRDFQKRKQTMVKN
ncbi:SsrA-binding protein SmpB [Patescibacteria group bacterium]|nr:SsrA-binding protein SmpB [Patescibacteria group bacterium]